MSEKIRPQHLERKAILYVRQSSPYQVHLPTETRRECEGRGDASAGDCWEPSAPFNLRRRERWQSPCKPTDFEVFMVGATGFELTTSTV
jgi:hypothetical protein